MAKDLKQAALLYHENGRPGKIEVIPTKEYSSQRDLALAYSPGVAFPCLEIEKNPADAYRYTDKGNLVGVISNGTAVLGLGDIGPLAGKPVMEGKALLFKIFSGLDAFDIEINEKDPDKFVEIVKALTPTFGGINLEDIKAPECFKIEERLRAECDIPIMHDDQHGTAIISSAGLINALELQDKKAEEIRLVVNGAGAAAISCTRMYIALGVKRENVVMCDSKGVIRADRTDLNAQKREFATTRDLHTLADAMRDADVFLGLSVKDVVTPEMLKSMAPRPIVFALANPDPEIAYELAVKSRPDLIMATGRSDYPNQINNVLGFPYIFRGALDCGASSINEAMKIAAARAIAAIAKLPVPSVVDRAYGLSDLHFGRQYILPKPLDPRLLTAVAPAVARAAHESGVARRPIYDYNAYAERLMQLMGRDSEMMRRITELAKKTPQRVVFADGGNDNMLEAACQLHHDGILRAVILGTPQQVQHRAAAIGCDLTGVEIINPGAAACRADRERYAEALCARMERRGMVPSEARKRLHERTYFGMMMTACGDADAFVAPTQSAGRAPMQLVGEIIGLRDGFTHFAAMHILNTRRGTFYLADTAINAVSDADTLVDITRLAAREVSFFAQNPAVALLSFSNFGSAIDSPESQRVAHAVERLHRDYPEICADGEMQVMYALDNDLRDRTFPFNRLKGRKVNTLVFPNLCAANTTYQMLLSMGVGEVIGPIQVGLRKPVHFINANASTRDIVNLATIAALDAACAKKA